MDEALLAFNHWLQHAVRQIRWRRLEAPHTIDTERQGVGHAEKYCGFCHAWHSEWRDA